MRSPTVKVNRLLLNNIDVVGVGWGGAWTMTHPGGALTEQWDGLAELLTSGALAAPQPEVYPLEQAAAAVSSLENRTARGQGRGPRPGLTCGRFGSPGGG